MEIDFTHVRLNGPLGDWRAKIERQIIITFSILTSYTIRPVSKTELHCQHLVAGPADRQVCFVNYPAGRANRCACYLVLSLWLLTYFEIWPFHGDFRQGKGKGTDKVEDDSISGSEGVLISAHLTSRPSLGMLCAL